MHKVSLTPLSFQSGKSSFKALVSRQAPDKVWRPGNVVKLSLTHLNCYNEYYYYNFRHNLTQFIHTLATISIEMSKMIGEHANILSCRVLKSCIMDELCKCFISMIQYCY